MGFVSNLAAAGSSPSGVANPLGSGTGNFGDILDVYNNIKDREMRDFQNKASFMADLSLKQDRLRKLYDTMDSTYGMGPQITDTQKTGTNPSGQPQQNVVLGQDPNALTGYQKADLSMKQNAQNIESQRVAQQGRIGQEQVDIKQQQEKLNQQKSDQIRDQKINELQQKRDAALQKANETDAKLKQQEGDFNKKLDAMKQHEANMKELHDAETKLKDAQHEDAQIKMKANIDALKQRLDQASKQTKSTTVGGETKTETITKGTQDKVQMYGPDGSVHMIPKDKVQDAKDNYQMSESKPDQQQDQNQDENE